jgi:hypothetical protein
MLLALVVLLVIAAALKWRFRISVAEMERNKVSAS